jgi:hypothetical protein
LGESLPVVSNQGDQIGRLFALWAIFGFVRFLGNCKIIPHLWAPLVYSYDEALMSAKNVLGYILGDFFTNSSGHTASNELKHDFFSFL